MNVFRNFVPNKYVTCDDKDPVWMNENIKSKIKAKNKLYQVYAKKADFCAVEESVRNLNDVYYKSKHLTTKIWGRSLMIQHSSHQYNKKFEYK